ncbi:MAG: transcription termination factor nusG family protein [Candidatus Xenolissoclinum pacificiensis L6]|uniref:Transcription termination factor nusG family protein n=1 Tax=Candidatus Xenolissoclinum pacificiensis L6 TaxID=1401685 RepID=W2V0L5_9RICK|nr:MAG: transcription termination factor nusG family protein [Candidatus Xenolissoclinum pacificiensis L6]
MEFKWYLFRVTSGKEGYVEKYLKENYSDHEDFSEVYIPRSIVAGSAGKLKKMLPGYVFIRMRMTEDFLKKIALVPKIFFISRKEGKPEEIPESQIEKLRSGIREVEDMSERSAVLDKGHRVRVEGGAFHGLYGFVKEIKDEDKVVVAISILGKMTEVLLNPDQLLKEDD